MKQQAWLQPDNQRIAERAFPSNPDFSFDLVSGVSAVMVTDETTLVIASPGPDRNIYVTDLLVTNGHDTVGTYVEIQSGTDLIYKGYAAAGGGGFVAALKTPIRIDANTPLTAKNVTDGSSVVVSASGYLGL